MTARTVVHNTFTVERVYPVAPGRVFAAFSTEAGKARWFVGPNEGWQLAERAFDFRVGGRERAKGVWKSGMVSDFQAIYLDIIPDARIVYAYDMYVDAKKISVSLGTVEIYPEGEGTRLFYTEQGAYFDGSDDGSGRKHGTEALFEQLAASLGD